MNSKQWIKIWFLIVAILILFIGGFNYIVDPYGFNNLITIDKINLKKISNTKYTTRFKSKFINTGKFDTIMLGTSRIGVMDPNIANRYLNGNTFNLDYPGSVTLIQKKLFFYALSSNNIKYVIYGIDFMSFNKNKTVENDFKEFYDLYNKIDNKEEIFNYDLYFNFDTFIDSIKLIVKNVLGTQKNETKYLFQNGMRDYTNYIDELSSGVLKIDENIKNSIKEYFKNKTGAYSDFKFSYEYLNYFRDIVVYCKENDIKLWVYIPPMHSDHFDAIYSSSHYKEFELFKIELSKIINYIDFTGHNDITTDKNNYWDSSHLRKKLTSTVFAKVFDDNSTEVLRDFGRLVTRDNVTVHLKDLKIKIKNYDIANK